jgi:hypothetical protein
MALDVKVAPARLREFVEGMPAAEVYRGELSYWGPSDAAWGGLRLDVGILLDRLERAEAVCEAAGSFMDTRCQRLDGEAFQKEINTADDAESKLYASVDRWREAAK